MMVSKKTLPISVLGAGSWGTALALLLARNGQVTRLWDWNPAHIATLQTQRVNARYIPGVPFPETLSLYADLQAAVADVEDILIVVPSHAFPGLVSKLKPLLKSNKHGKFPRIAWGTKGLDPNSGRFLHQFVAEELGHAVPVAILAGPTFATEVAAGLPSAITLAANNRQFADDLLERLHNNHFRVYLSTDLIGVQVCGTVKNVLAVATGICDSLQLGANARCALLTRGLAEMTRLGLALGGQLETFLGLAGVGDLVLTCHNDLSRNRRFGLALGQGLNIEAAVASIGQAVESIDNVELVHDLAQKQSVVMPVVEQVYQVLHHGKLPSEAVEALMSRDPAVEVS